MVKFFSNGCPRCKIIKSALESKKIPYEQVTDIKEIIRVADEFGETSLPFAMIDNKFYGAIDLQKWVISQEAK